MALPPHHTPAYWIIVPAAGVGTRMGSDIPKQYLPLLDKTVIEYTLDALLAVPGIAGIYVSLSAEDSYWQDLPIASREVIRRVKGGAERADSVLNALEAVSLQAQDDDWVLVHDAARPCVCPSDIQRLIEQVGDHPVGGILGVPVSDTLKKIDQGTIQSTLDRRDLWQAQTPQMFRLGLLRHCLQQAIAEKKTVTDEASAVEAYGFHPLMVKGRTRNLKVTYPDDLAIASFLLTQENSSLRKG